MHFNECMRVNEFIVCLPMECDFDLYGDTQKDQVIYLNQLDAANQVTIQDDITLNTLYQEVSAGPAKPL